MAIKVNAITPSRYSLAALSKKKKIGGGDSGILTNRISTNTNKIKK